MSRDKAKGIFVKNKTQWTKEVMDNYTDVVFDNIDSNKEEVKDYVIESDRTTNGTWEKWASGKAQLIMGANKPVPANGHHNIVIDLPVEFVMDANHTYVNAIPRTASGNVSGMRVTRSFLSSANQVTISVESTLPAVQNGVFQILVIGGWK